MAQANLFNRFLQEKRAQSHQTTKLSPFVTLWLRAALLLFIFVVAMPSQMITAQSGSAVIRNGTFDDGNDQWWYQELTKGATFRFKGQGCAVITDGGENPWDVQIGQADLKLIIGQRYRILMTVTSTSERPLSLRMYGSAPWETYTHPFFELAEGVTEIDHLFTMSANDSAVNLAIHFGGGESGLVCIDNVRIVTAATPVQKRISPDPLPKPFSNPQYGKVTPLLWLNDARSALSLTFDDGTESHYVHARPILNKHDLLSTFYVNSGMTINLDRAATWGQIIEMSQEGHEIGSHTWTHQRLPGMTTGDINTPYTVHHELHLMKVDIETHIPDEPVISFAYPFTETDDQASELVSQYHMSGRSADNKANPAYDAQIDWYNLSAWAAAYGKPRRTIRDDQMELDAMESYIVGGVVGTGKWGIILFHEIVPFDELADNKTWHPTSTDFLTRFTEQLRPLIANDHIWVDTVGNVTRYIKERDNLQTYVTEEEPDLIRIYVTDNLDDRVFDHPLTVNITVPPEWASVNLFQGEQLLGEVEHEDGVITADIIPDNGLVTLANSTIPASEVELPGRSTYIGIYLSILVPLVALLAFGGYFAIQQKRDDE